MSTKEAAPVKRTPGTRLMLPFRVEPGSSFGRRTTVLRYDGEVYMMDRSRKKQEHAYDVGFSGADPHAQCINPLGAAILATIRMYQELEDEYDRLARELEATQEAKSALEGEMATLRRQVAAHEGQGGKKKGKESDNGHG